METQTTEFERFFAAYVHAALYTSEGPQETRKGNSMLACGMGIEHLAPETRETMLQDCAKFWLSYRLYLLEKPDGLECGGMDLWFTRNHHGTGFWDNPHIYSNTETLTNAAQEFGEVSLYVGDDGLIYQCTG